MSTIYINQVTASGKPEDVAALKTRLASGEDEEVHVLEDDSGFVVFTTWSRRGPSPTYTRTSGKSAQTFISHGCTIAIARE